MAALCHTRLEGVEELKKQDQEQSTMINNISTEICACVARWPRDRDKRRGKRGLFPLLLLLYYCPRRGARMIDA